MSAYTKKNNDNGKLGARTLSFFFGNNEAAHFHFREYINGNQTFILDSHWPFICSVGLDNADSVVELSRKAVGK